MVQSTSTPISPNPTISPVGSTAPESAAMPPDDGPANTSILRRAAGVFRLIPTLLVLGVLAGLGYWGHHTGWSLDKFSEVTGRAEAGTDDWCEEHGVPESICIACKADLMPKPEPHGWCEEHGVFECPLHHPDVAQLGQTPKIEERDLERAARALKLRKRAKNNPACQLHLRRLQFVSNEAAEQAGIDIGLVDRQKIVETIPANGEVTYDQTLIARLSSRAAGTVWRVYRNIGDEVRQGDVLAVIDASEVGRQKAELLAAVIDLDLKQVKRDQLKKVAGRGVAETVLQEAEAAFSAATVRVQKSVQGLVNLGFSITTNSVLKSDRKTLADHVRFLGIPDDISRYLDREHTTSNLIPLRAPADGTIVARDAVAGEVIDTTKVLFSVVDTRRMWLLLSVAMEHAALLKHGQEVRFRPDGKDDAVTGKITWLSTKVDPHTRTVKARVELSNRDGALRDATFGQGEVVLREDAGSIVVPNSAVHWEGCCHVVFVRDKDYLKKGSYKVFHTRVVRTGVRTSTHTEILAGLMPWEVIVTKGGGVLRAELLKGNLGPG